MTLVLGVLIVAAALAFVAAPFFTKEPAAALPGPPSRGQLERQKLDAYAAIKEAEFDYRMGKLSELDFTALRDKYAARALEAIAALDSASAAHVARPMTEAQRPTRVAFCPMCGHTVPPRANFCPSCGFSIRLPGR